MKGLKIFFLNKKNRLRKNAKKGEHKKLAKSNKNKKIDVRKKKLKERDA